MESASNDQELGSKTDQLVRPVTNYETTLARKKYIFIYFWITVRTTAAAIESFKSTISNINIVHFLYLILFQQYFVCDYAINVDCQSAESFYSLNENFGQVIEEEARK